MTTQLISVLEDVVARYPELDISIEDLHQYTNTDATISYYSIALYFLKMEGAEMTQYNEFDLVQGVLDRLVELEANKSELPRRLRKLRSTNSRCFK
jgi:hypothetical protein